MFSYFSIRISAFCACLSVSIISDLELERDCIRDLCLLHREFRLLQALQRLLLRIGSGQPSLLSDSLPALDIAGAHACACKLACEDRFLDRLRDLIPLATSTDQPALERSPLFVQDASIGETYVEDIGQSVDNVEHSILLEREDSFLRVPMLISSHGGASYPSQPRLVPVEDENWFQRFRPSITEFIQVRR